MKFMMHKAAKWRSISLMKSLLDKGANINELDERGFTPLDYAIANCDAAWVDYLKSKGATSGKGNASTNGICIGSKNGAVTGAQLDLARSIDIARMAANIAKPGPSRSNTEDNIKQYLATPISTNLDASTNVDLQDAQEHNKVTDSTISEQPQRNDEATPCNSNLYLDNADGTATVARNGLMWMRCTIGQTWNGSVCIGKASHLSWNDASQLKYTYAEYDDWRLPNIDELKTIQSLDRACSLTADLAFPSNPNAVIWSSTVGPRPDLALGRNIRDGSMIVGMRGSTYQVRLVRDCTKTAHCKGAEDLFHDYEIGMSVDEVENATMKDGETAYIFYLSITNNHTKQVRVELPFSTYITAAKEEIEQDVWLAGYIIGGKGATIRSGAHRKAGLVFHKTKLPSITIGDQLYVEVELPKTSLKYTVTFRCLDQEKRKFALLDMQSQSSNNAEILGNDIAAKPGTSHHVSEIIARFDRLENRFEESMHRIDSALAAILTGQSTGLDAIVQIGHSAIATEKLTVALSVLRQDLISPPRPAKNHIATAPQCAPNSEQETPALNSIAAFTAWLAGQQVIPLSELRIRLYPLDLLPSAVIDDINDRALNLTDELALLEEGDNVIVQQEVLLKVNEYYFLGKT